MVLTRMMENYNLIAKQYAEGRMESRIGLKELDDLLAKLPQVAQILDFGAGTGKPITERIAQDPHQFKIFAVDSSVEMVKIFGENFPSIPIQCASILDFDFVSETFDAVVAWGVMFHLTETEQKSAIQRISSALNNGGYFLFTSGNEAGMRSGAMFGVDFSYYSLGSENYRQTLAEQGMTLLSEHFGEGENYYYLAQKHHKI